MEFCGFYLLFLTVKILKLEDDTSTEGSGRITTPSLSPKDDLWQTDSKNATSPISFLRTSSERDVIPLIYVFSRFFLLCSAKYDSNKSQGLTDISFAGGSESSDLAFGIKILSLMMKREDDVITWYYNYFYFVIGIRKVGVEFEPQASKSITDYVSSEGGGQCPRFYRKFVTTNLELLFFINYNK